MKKKTSTLLVDMINQRYYRAYDEMIERLRPLLLTPEKNRRLIERLAFRADLQRGDRTLIYRVLADLVAHPGIMARGYCKDDLFRWLSDERHCNLGVKFGSLKRIVYKAVRDVG